MCCDDKSGIQLGRNAQIELANLKEDMQRLLELGAKFIEVLAVKVSAATKLKKFTAKQVDIFI